MSNVADDGSHSLSGGDVGGGCGVSDSGASGNGEVSWFAVGDGGVGAVLVGKNEIGVVDPFLCDGVDVDAVATGCPQVRQR